LAKKGKKRPEKPANSNLASKADNSPSDNQNGLPTFLIFAVIAGGILLFGFMFWNAGRKEESSEPKQETNRSAAWEESTERVRLALPENNPATDGWSSEVFEADAKKQLKTVLGVIITPTGSNAKLPSDLAHDEFKGSPFFDLSMRTAIDRPPFKIKRAKSLPIAYEGTDGLVRAVNDMRALLDNATIKSSELKVVNVDLSNENQPSTTQFVSFAGVENGNKDGGQPKQFEYHATWKSTWNLGVRAGAKHVSRPLLERLEVVDLEYSTVAQNNPLLADCTAGMLGDAYNSDSVFIRGHADFLNHVETRFQTHLLGYRGLALGDANGDDFEDVYLCHPGGMTNQLLVRQDDGSVIDRAKEAGLDFLDATHSALFIDLNNDGDQDLVLGMYKHVLVLENENGKFKPAARMPVREAYVSSLAAADYDNDGDLDFYVCYYFAGRQPLPRHDANNGPPNEMWRNEGDFKFLEVSRINGLDENNSRFTYAACWEDYDNDGDVDLYVANDYGRNCLYENNAGQFKNVAAAKSVEDSASGMSVTFADYDHNGRMDVYVSNMFSSAGNRIVKQPKFNPYASVEDRKMLLRHARGNSLFRSTEKGFDDSSTRANVTMGRWAWGSLFADLNNDSFDDLCVANGFITNELADDL